MQEITARTTGEFMASLAQHRLVLAVLFPTTDGSSQRLRSALEAFFKIKALYEEVVLIVREDVSFEHPLHDAHRLEPTMWLYKNGKEIHRLHGYTGPAALDYALSQRLVQ